MKFIRKRFIVMRNDRTEVWAGEARNYRFRKLNDIDKCNIRSYHSEKKARASCSSWMRDFEIVPVTEILELENSGV